MEGVKNRQFDAVRYGFFSTEAVRLVQFERAARKPSYRNLADIGVVTEIRDKKLRNEAIVSLGARYSRDDRLEQGLEVGRPVVDLYMSYSGFGIGIENREIDLFFRGIEIDEQIIDLINNRVDPRIGAVDFIDHQNDGKLLFQSLSQHEPGLRKRPFAGIDEQERAVDQVEAPFHLAAEIGVPGRIDDVDLDIVVLDRAYFSPRW